MSLHPRKEIRDAIVAALVSETGAGLRVYANRVRHWRSRNLPAIGVYLDSEVAEHEDSAPRVYQRVADIRVEIVADADEQLDDLLDAEALKVENLLLADPQLGGLLADLEFTSTEINFIGDGETVFGSAALAFHATYWTEPPEPVLDDFETAHVEYDMAAPDEVIEAVDTITMPTEEEA